MLKKALLCLSLTALCLLSLALPGAARNQNQFVMHNDSDWTITSFRTKEGRESFSPNWIKGEKLRPGESFEMEFFEDGPCEVEVKIISDDGYVHDYVIDFCRAQEIFIENRSVSYR